MEPRAKKKKRLCLKCRKPLSSLPPWVESMGMAMHVECFYRDDSPSHREGYVCYDSLGSALVSGAQVPSESPSHVTSSDEPSGAWEPSPEGLPFHFKEVEGRAKP